MIRPDDIDHDVARGLDRKEGAEREAPSGFSVLWKSGPLLILAATLMLFHFGNGAMLPLLGQQVAAQAEQDTTAGAATGTADTAPASAAGTTTTAVSPGQSTAGVRLRSRCASPRRSRRSSPTPCPTRRLPSSSRS